MQLCKKLIPLHFFIQLLYVHTITMSRYLCFSSCKRSSSEIVNPVFCDDKLQARQTTVETTRIHKAVEHITWKTATPYIPPVTQGMVIKVYDGDTITIATVLPHYDTVYRFSVRLLGIDTAEMKGGTFAEKESAIKARDALASKILGKMILLENVSLEKYGRILADVHYNDVHINKWMLDQGLAVAYDGGTKHKSDELTEHW